MMRHVWREVQLVVGHMVSDSRAETKTRVSASRPFAFAPTQYSSPHPQVVRPLKEGGHPTFAPYTEVMLMVRLLRAGTPSLSALTSHLATSSPLRPRQTQLLGEHPAC